MKSIELVIFDCDGVLVDSETITNALLVSMLKPLGIDFTRAEFVRRYVGITLEDFKKRIVHELNVELPETFIIDYHHRALELLQQNLIEVAGIRNLIERLNVPFAVASNSNAAKVKMMLEKTDLLKYFDGNIFSSTQVANPKPAPDVYLLAASTNKTKPENCIVIEDTPTGIKAGKAAGMTVYGYEGLFPAKVLTEAGADYLFNHMNQLFING